MTDPNAAEWLSAWSTFWGAIATGLGAVGTAGAFWLAAIVYRRQEQDQRRAQASAVTVSISEATQQRGLVTIEVRNDSQLPIYSVMLFATKDHQDIGHVLRATLPRDEKISFQRVFEPGLSAHALYMDTAGRKWRRYFNGDLVEVWSQKRPKYKPVSLSSALGPDDKR